MGIERFFNSLRKDYNIVRDISSKDNYILNSENLFFDFNSIIHVVSQKVLSLINNLMLEIIVENNGCGTDKSDEIITLFHNIINDFSKPESNEDKVIEYFKEYFTKDKIDNIIIYFVSLFVIDLLKNRFKKNKLKLIYIAIDGVPSKAKIVEQKKRRFMGEFDKNIKKLILEKNKKKLNIDKNKGCNSPFNKYKYCSNMIRWSKSNISPATSFMIMLDQYLNSTEFKIKIKTVITGIDTSKIIISGYNKKDEAEKKIIDYINDIDNSITDSICIYSPDADVILLSLLIKSKSIVHILRHDQQKSDIFKDPIKAVYNVININNLKIQLFDYINIVKLDIKQTFNLNKQKVINDIVFIFTIFGDDFLHKIESFDVRNDIGIILELYQENHKILRNKSIMDSYILKGKTVIEINYENFISLFQIMANKEDEMIKRNYYTKKYQNYKRLINKINKQLEEKKGKNKKFNIVDHNNIKEFIDIYNYNQTIKSFVNNIIKLINKFITEEVKSNMSTKYKNITWQDINKIPIHNFIKFYKETFKNDNNQNIYNKLKRNRNFTNLLKKYLDREKLYKKIVNIKNKIQIKRKDENYIDHMNDIQLIDELIMYLYNYSQFPKTLDDYIIGFNIPKNNFIYLKKYDTSLTSSYHQRITNNFSGYEKDIYKYERMLDEYQKKLNKIEESVLGDPNKSLNESKKIYYETYFGKEKNKAIHNYLDGLQWIVDYYYNNITYHKWYYMYDKSPLIKEILAYLKNTDNTNFINAKEVLEKCCLIKKSVEMLTPLEQLLYITPFNKQNIYTDMFSNYSSENKEKIINIITKIFGSQEYKFLYPDIKKIAKEVFENDSNIHIDCRGAFFLNKCILNVVHDSNMIDESNIRKLIRKIIPVDSQNEQTKVSDMRGGYNNLSSEYIKYKKLFIMTGELKYKRKYKSIKKILNDIF